LLGPICLALIMDYHLLFCLSGPDSSVPHKNGTNFFIQHRFLKVKNLGWATQKANTFYCENSAAQTSKRLNFLNLSIKIFVEKSLNFVKILDLKAKANEVSVRHWQLLKRTKFSNNGRFWNLFSSLSYWVQAAKLADNN
jgi:hypothetical protein